MKADRTYISVVFPPLSVTGLPFRDSRGSQWYTHSDVFIFYLDYSTNGDRFDI